MSPLETFLLAGLYKRSCERFYSSRLWVLKLLFKSEDVDATLRLKFDRLESAK